MPSTTLMSFVDSASRMDVSRATVPDTYKNICDFVKKEYKDLDSAERSIIIDYISAYQRRFQRPHTFVKEKRKVIALIGKLYDEALICPAGSRKEPATIKLAELSKLIRGGGIKLSEIRSILGRQDIGTMIRSKELPQLSFTEITNGHVMITPDQLPEEVKNILRNTKRSNGTSYWDYIKANCNFLFFTPRLDLTVKVVKKGDIGTAEELTRTVIVDTADEGVLWSSAWPAWDIAASIVHETAHIEWYHKNNDIQFALTHAPNERAALVVERAFLNSLLSSDISLGILDRNDINYMIRKTNEEIAFIDSQRKSIEKLYGISK